MFGGECPNRALIKRNCSTKTEQQQLVAFNALVFIVVVCMIIAIVGISYADTFIKYNSARTTADCAFRSLWILDSNKAPATKGKREHAGVRIQSLRTGSAQST